MAQRVSGHGGEGVMVGFSLPTSMILLSSLPYLHSLS